MTSTPEGQFPTAVPNAVFDIAFSEKVPDIVATAGGDGILRVAPNDQLIKAKAPQPVAAIQVSTKELNTVECNFADPVKILKAESLCSLLHTRGFKAHQR